MDTNWKHQKDAITTDQKNRVDDEHIREADKRHLNGHVSTILSRGSVGAADLLGLLQQVVEKANGKPVGTTK